MRIVRKAFPSVIALPHFIETLSQTGAGWEGIGQMLANGTVSALVPECVPESRLYDLKHGGILAPLVSTGATASNIQPIPNTAEFLAKELGSLDGLDCLIHDPLKEVGEAFDTDGQPTLIGGSLFYLSPNCIQPESNLLGKIRRNTLSWHFLQFIGRYQNKELTTLNAVLQNSVCIVVGAYDGESYLIWRRN